LGGAIAATNPNYFGRKARKQTDLAEIGIFGDDEAIVLARVIPNGVV